MRCDLGFKHRSQHLLSSFSQDLGQGILRAHDWPVIGERRRLWRYSQELWITESRGDPGSILELNASDDVSEEFVAVQFSPFSQSADCASLKTMVRHAMRDPDPLVLFVLSRTVAKVDSIGLVVLRCRQCSAGKS